MKNWVINGHTYLVDDWWQFDPAGNLVLDGAEPNNTMIEHPFPQYPWLAIQRADEALDHWHVDLVYVPIGDSTNDGTTNVYMELLDEHGTPLAGFRFLAQAFPGETVTFVTTALGQANFALFCPGSGFDPAKGEVGPQSAYVLDSTGKLPSDEVLGMGIPLCRHVQHRLTFRKKLGVGPNPSPPPPPPPPPSPPPVGLKQQLQAIHDAAQATNDSLQKVINGLGG